MNNFDYEGAKNAGYSDEEINSYLSENNPSFDVNSALESGYSPQEITQYLSSNNNEPDKKERSLLEKGSRVAGQFALGAAESALLPYELSTIPLASKEAQNVLYRENLGDELEQLMEKKAYGQWSDEDQKFFEHITEQIKDPRKSLEFAQTAEIGIRDLIEKSTGLDLKPEGILEKTAHWTGFIKNPKKIAELAKTGINLSDLTKAIAPSGKELLRGIGAGTALEMAEKGDFGPIGTMASAVLGDVIGGGISSAAKGAMRFLKEPKKVLAEVAASFNKSDKLDLQKDLIKDFRESNIQADIGTLTDSDLVKWTQSRLSQSGLTGNALDDLKKQLTNQIKTEYKAISESIGDSIFENNHQAGEVAREGIKNIRDADLAETRDLYQKARLRLKESSVVDPVKIEESIKNLEKNLKPGNVKSTEQKVVLDILDKLKNDIFDSQGNAKYAKVKDLMNDKIALNEIINYEVQGGAKSLLRDLVKEIDRSIISYGKQDPIFSKNYIQANKRFSQHAKEFRNKNALQILKTEDPAQLMNKMNNVQGIRDLSKILKKTPEGEEIFDAMKRLKLDQIISNNFIDSTTQQIKLGTFSKLLEKGKSKDLVREILPPQAFNRLRKLQSNSGKLAESAQKFYNASKTGASIEDAGIVAKVLTDLTHLISGNPWPLVRTGTGITGARYLTRLIADPEFLNLVEEVILASEKNDKKLLLELGKKLVEPVKAAIISEKNHSSNPG